MRRGTSLGLALACAAACARVPPGTPVPASGPSRLPPVPLVRGPLRIAVVYPAPTDVVDVRDSIFLFGSVGTGLAQLTVNGAPVRVWPDGGWLAWVAAPNPADSIMSFILAARTAGDSATLVYPVRRSRRFIPPPSGVWIDSASATPAGRVWWPAGEYLPLSIRAAEGATVRVRFPGGLVVPLAPDAGLGEVSVAIRAFDRDTNNLVAPREADRYTGAIRGLAVGSDPGPFLGHGPGPSPGGDSGAVVEAILGSDTARVRWPLRIALLDTVPDLMEFNDDTAGTGTTDSLTVGRARPGATYHWFFPTGTRVVASGRLGDDLRVRLSRGQEAWVAAPDAVPLPRGGADLRGTVGSLTLTPAPDRLTLRVPVTERVPFRVEESAGRLTLRLYNAVSDANWTRYGRTDPYVRDISWQQETADELTITLTLSGPVWGYRARWDRNDLLFEVHRPPAIHAGRPLEGLLIVVDPGHPPLGATGPTGLREAEANLHVALLLRDLLAEGGARVVMTRSADQSLELWPRVKLADSLGADLLISVHNNALPDGVNPFTNSGASVFYNHPRSLPLAREIQAALVERLGVRDLGVARGDLALVRPTWMPAVLTEGLFMMLPDQEAALRSPDGQRAYALAVRDGIVHYLQRVAEGSGPNVP